MQKNPKKSKKNSVNLAELSVDKTSLGWLNLEEKSHREKLRKLIEKIYVMRSFQEPHLILPPLNYVQAACNNPENNFMVYRKTNGDYSGFIIGKIFRENSCGVVHLDVVLTKKGAGKQLMDFLLNLPPRLKERFEGVEKIAFYLKSLQVSQVQEFYEEMGFAVAASLPSVDPLTPMVCVKTIVPENK